MFGDDSYTSEWNDLLSMSSEDLVHDDTPSPAITDFKQEEVLRMPSDLVACRNRIDANTKEQRKHRDVLAALNEKILELRKRNAESTARLVLSQTLPAIPTSSQQYGPLSISTNSCDLPITSGAAEPQPLMSSTVIDSELFSNDDFNRSLNFVLVQLDEEIERNEKVQEQNFILQSRVEGISKANESMREEISRMSKEVERLRSESEMERHVFIQSNEKKQHKSEAQHQVILALRNSFHFIKRQVQDLRAETESDLERQRTELVNCANNMEIALKQACLQLQNSRLSKKDECALDEILKEYEELTTRYLQVVEEQNEKSRKITELEASVKKVNEDRDAAHESLKKILMMPELTDVRSRKSRSLSPSGHLTFDTIQFVRTALRDQEDEIRQLKWAHDEQKSLVAELHDQLAKSDEVRKIMLKEVSDLQKEVETLRYEKADAEHECSRGKEKIGRLEADRAQSLLSVERLQKQIVTINESHQATVEEILEKQTEECARLRKQFDDEKAENERDYNFKLERIRMDLQQLKEEKEAVDDLLQSTQSDHDILRNRLREKEDEVTSKNASINELKEEIEELQRSLSDAKENNVELEEKLNQLDADIAKSSQNLAQLELEKKLLKEENTTVKGDFDLLKAELSDKMSFMQKLQDSHREAVENATELRKELSTFKNKAADLESERSLLIAEMKAIKEERSSLERGLTERNSELASFSSKYEGLEETYSSVVRELENEQAKVGNLETQLIRISAENEHLSHDLYLANETLEKKTESSQRAMNELLENYRSVEKARSEILSEKENVIEELSALKEKFRKSEERNVQLQERLDGVEALKTDIQKKLCHFEDCARNAMKAARTQSSVRSGEKYDKNGHFTHVLNTTSPGNFYHLRGSSSSHDLASPHVNFDETAIRRSAEQLDISSSIEITFSILRNRIEELENDKKTLAETVSRLKIEFTNADGAKNDLSKKIESLQKNLSEYQEAQRALESRLASSRQLLVSQEENLRSKDQQQKTLKARLLSADLHTRDKDAKIASLNDVIAALKAEVSSLEEDKKELKETVVLFELERTKADSLQRQTDDELLKYRSEVTALHNKKQDLAYRLKETEEQLAASQKRCLELEKTVKECRDFIRDLKKDEGHWKKKANLLGRKEEEDIDKQQRIDHLQMDLEEALVKHKAALKEKDVLKKEFQDARSQQSRSAQKIADLQQTVCTLTLENNQLKQRLAVLEKSQKDGRSLGSLLHDELQQLRADKLKSAAERQNLRRRIEKAESERRELEAQRVRLERERAALKQHIETLELEKQKTDAATKQTNIERLALDKSLSAMEKENRELYKNCAQLQKQVAQLESENGSQLLNENVAQRRVSEAQLQRVKVEKQELEQKLAQFEQMHAQSMKFLESKINVLTKQLEVERKRRHNCTNRPSVDEHSLEESRLELDMSSGSLQQLRLNTPHCKSVSES